MFPKTRTIENKMMQSLFTLFADQANGTISGCSPRYTSIQTKITHKSNLHTETTDKVWVIQVYVPQKSMVPQNIHIFAE